MIITTNYGGFVDRICQSTFANFCNTLYAHINPLTLARNSLKDASVEYQSLAQEAHTKLSVQETLIVKEMPAFLIYFGEKVSGMIPAACQEPNLTLINTAVLNQASYSIKRFSLFHEMAHAKNHDKLCTGSIAIVSMIISEYGVKHALPYSLFFKNNETLPPLLVMLTKIITGLAVLRYYGAYCEHKADLRAARACMCFKCVQEVADTLLLETDKKKAQSKHLGYSSAEELNAIAQELKRKNLLCVYHKKQR